MTSILGDPKGQGMKRITKGVPSLLLPSQIILLNALILQMRKWRPRGVNVPKLAARKGTDLSQAQVFHLYSLL